MNDAESKRNAIIGLRSVLVELGPQILTSMCILSAYTVGHTKSSFC